MAARTVTILGSTGSVGVSTLDLLEQAGADVEILALIGRAQRRAPGRTGQAAGGRSWP